MNDSTCPGKTLFRVWVVRYLEEPPTFLRGVPSGVVAIEPAERKIFTARKAVGYVEAFNRAALAGGHKIWAVAVPVRVCYEGEPRPGEKIA